MEMRASNGSRKNSGGEIPFFYCDVVGVTQSLYQKYSY